MEQNDKKEPDTDRSYTADSGAAHLNFDPLKDLNLPSSYEEVLSAFANYRANAHGRL
ncbi:MAG: hypothetical protein IPI95_08270 [Flavobacteriales bacterium]|nr:hypothetical protein [Flavobacteriales bacterium]